MTTSESRGLPVASIPLVSEQEPLGVVPRPALVDENVMDGIIRDAMPDPAGSGRASRKLGPLVGLRIINPRRRINLSQEDIVGGIVVEARCVGRLRAWG